MKSTIWRQRAASFLNLGLRQKVRIGDNKKG